MRRLLPLLGLLLVLAVALAARTHKLGTYGFWTDEMYHVIAAQSLAETGRPYLPAYRTGEYKRAYPVTAITAWAFTWFGASEAAARAPFVAANVAFLVLFFLVVRRWFNVQLALLGVLALALMPHELILGREVRMYGLFQLLYFAAAALLYEVLETPLARGRRALLLAAALALIALAAWVQALAVNLGIALGAYCLGMLSTGSGAGRRGRYALVLALIGGGALAVWLAVPWIVDWLVIAARVRPPWAQETTPFAYYSWFFTYYYPGLTFLYPLGAALLVRDHGRRGWFVVASFVPLLIAHILVFTGRVEERYVSYLLPYFVLGAAYAIQLAAAALGRMIAAEWRRGARALATLLLLAALPIAGLLGHTWFRESVNLLRYGYGPNWKTVAPVLRALPADAVVMTPWPLHLTWYGERFPDYILRPYQPEDSRAPEGRLGARPVAQRWLYDAAEFERVAAAAPALRLVTTEWALANDAYTPPAVREAIARLMKREEHPGDPGVLLFTKPE